MIVVRCVAGLCALLIVTSSFAQTPKYFNASLPVDDRVNDLVKRMTLDEKVSQMVNQSVAIPRLNIPAYDWWNEGLHGVARSGYATVFPQAIGLGATWDKDLLHRVATTISTEARAKYHQALRDNIHSIYYGLTIWSPNINIFRDPRWGRGQETYGEDPYLTSRLGVAFVKGLQGSDAKYLKVVATPKHFAVHSGPEADRHKFDVSPSPYDLEDTYLPAFRATVTEAHADSVMCAYNRVDGVPACANTSLLQNTLRRDWRFQGFVTSDCGAISDFYVKGRHNYSPDAAHAAAAGVLAGTDTSCGTENKALTQSVQQGLIKEADIDIAVRRLFTARFRLGQFDDPAIVPYAQIPFSQNDSAEHRAIALEAARKSIVLLKNQSNLLPLTNKTRSIAVIGPNAASLASLEGNYNAVASKPVLAIDGIRQAFSGATINYAQGAPFADQVSLPVPSTALHPQADVKETGLKAEYFANTEFSGEPALSRTDKQIDFDWNSAAPDPSLKANEFSVRWTGVIKPPAPGEYRFDIGFAHCYPCYDRESYKVFIDDQQLSAFSSDESKSSRPSANKPFVFQFNNTNAHAIRVEYSHRAALFGAGVTLNWRPPKAALLSEAVAAAKQSDVVIAFIGLSPELEGEEMPVQVEGFARGDRTDIKLPAAQQQMLEAVAATGKPIVAVLMNGSALAVNWVDQHAAAVVEAWYPGEAGGQAIAETLNGINNPSGRLPVTFYAGLDQLPAFSDYSMTKRTYRYFRGKPLYEFGFGLSYTKFAYSNLRLSATTLNAGEPLIAEFDIRNVGAIAGDEVAQLYLTPPQKPEAPRHALTGFERVTLAAGESRHIRFPLEARDLSTVSQDGKRSVQPGTYRIAVGGSQPAGSSPLSAPLTITGSKSLPQ